MYDVMNRSYIERRSALITHDVIRLVIVIAPLSEVRFADEGCLHDVGACFTLIWCGRISTDGRLSSVGSFIVMNYVASNLKYHHLPL